nr:hypothetical protein [Saccharopolyspora erythraea]
MGFHDDSADPGPQVVIDPAEHLRIGVPRTDPEQVDGLDLLAFGHPGQRGHPDRAGPFDRVAPAEFVRLPDVAAPVCGGCLGHRVRQFPVPGLLPERAVEGLPVRHVAEQVLPEAFERGRDRFEGEDSGVRKVIGKEDRGKSVVRTDIRDVGTGPESPDRLRVRAVLVQILPGGRHFRR